MPGRGPRSDTDLARHHRPELLFGASRRASADANERPL